MDRSDSDDFRQIFLEEAILLDVRAPVEFERGAFGTACNIPLMSNSERHLVGICYQNKGQEAAIQLGRELVDTKAQSVRTNAWIKFAEDNPNGYLYCFRGGLRSRITQQWMADAGIRYPYIKGGYKAMRRFLIDQFMEDVESTPLTLISGRTGTGKTILLNKIARSIDLEGLANHRGSSFGPMAEPQPTTINFENELAIRMLKLSCLRNREQVFVEGEGRLVGKMTLPEVLWNKMLESPTIILQADIERRIDIGVQDYVVDLLQRIQNIESGDKGFNQFTDRHRNSLQKISRRLGGVRYGQASKFLEQALQLHRRDQDLAGYRPFIKLLLEHYYDPMYDYQLSRRTSKILFQGNESEVLDWLDGQGVKRLQ